MPEVIVAEQLSRTFGEFVAVDNVSFSVPAGEIFGFLGPNGAGKTTTIKMLTGLLRPTAGTATVAGLDIATHASQVRQRIGYMSQKFSLYPDLTVAENIALFAGLYGVLPDRLLERQRWIVEMAGLAGQESRLTAELSLGWKQRLALGCAVLHEPAVLFLDEPTSGVDPLSRRRFWALINALAESGTTVMVSTHFLEEAEYCHRVALMNRGRLIALDRPAVLRAAMTEPLLSISTDDAPRALAALRHLPLLHDLSLYGRKVHAVATEFAPAAAAVRGALAAAGIPLHGLEQVAPSLEDVFVDLIRREGGAVAG
jgi:ABC-2 type transport system ATP-binding protein